MKAALYLTLALFAAADTVPSGARAEVEAAYAKVRASLKSKDFETFLAAIEPATQQPAPSREDFVRAAGRVLDSFPDLATTRFVKVTMSGDWLGYYSLTDLDDPIFVNISLLRFHRAANGWKLSGASSGASFRKSGTAADEKRVAREIDTNVNLRLPGQPGYKQ